MSQSHSVSARPATVRPRILARSVRGTRRRSPTRGFRALIAGRLEPLAPPRVSRSTGAFAAKAVVKPNLRYGFPTGRRECVGGRPHWCAAGGDPSRERATPPANPRLLEPQDPKQPEPKGRREYWRCRAAEAGAGECLRPSPHSGGAFLRRPATIPPRLGCRQNRGFGLLVHLMDQTATGSYLN